MTNPECTNPRVWVKEPLIESSVVDGETLYVVAGLEGQVVLTDSDGAIPDHPALPAVARWLAEHGDSLFDSLVMVYGLAGDGHVGAEERSLANGVALPERLDDAHHRAIGVIGALIAALTEV